MTDLIVVTPKDLTTLADSIEQRAKSGPALSKSAILNMIAATICGPKHDWGFITHGVAETLTSQRASSAIRQEEPAAEPTRAEIIARANPNADIKDIKVSAVDIADVMGLPKLRSEKPKPFLSEEMADDIVNGLTSVYVLTSPPAVGAEWGIEQAAKRAGRKYRNIRMAAMGREDTIRADQPVGSRLHPNLLPSEDPQVITLYSDVDSLTDEELMELVCNLIPFTAIGLRGSVVLKGSSQEELMRRFRKMSGVADRLVWLDIGR